MSLIKLLMMRECQSGDKDCYHSTQIDIQDAETGLTKDGAMDWVHNMKFADASVGPNGKWTPQEIRPFAEACGIAYDTEEFYEFYAVMHAMYADYYQVAQQYGVNKPDFYAQLAYHFIHDPDAVENKVALYRQFITK